MLAFGINDQRRPAGRSPWAAIADPAADPPVAEGRPTARAAAVNNMGQTVGNEMMTRYVIPFEVAGLLLTAALVGAIALAYREGDDAESPRPGRSDRPGPHGTTDGHGRQQRRGDAGRDRRALAYPLKSSSSSAAMSDDIPLTWFLYFAAASFSIGLLGVLVRRNAIAVLMAIEIMLNAANINFVAFWRYGDAAQGEGPLTGVMVAIFVITIAAAEVAVGIGLILLCYRRWHAADVDRYDSMSG